MLTAKREIHTAAEVLFGLAVVLLVTLGIGGTIYKVIAPDGWVAAAFGRSLSAGTATLGSLVVIAGLAWYSRGWSTAQNRNRFSDFLVFAFAAAGIVYVSQLWLKGTF